jgi:phytoene dehydrogenase-like protein
MNSPASYDAIVIGGGVSGLVAAAYLAKMRKKVVLLEEKRRLGGLCGPANPGSEFPASVAAQILYALDPQVVRDLNLLRRGLRFAGRELSSVGLRSDGKHIVFSRNVHDTVASILPHSSADAAAWPHFRNKLFDLARALRPLWWEAHGALPDGAAGREIERIACMGASAWLDTWFESEALKAALCFDAMAGGLSIAEPGSALSLLWRAAQEILGLQGAVVIPVGGLPALAGILVSVAEAAGCDLRTDVGVAGIVVEENRVAGVRLRSGESCFAPLVFSTIGLDRTVHELLPPGMLGFAHAAALHPTSPLAEARVVVTLRNKPPLGMASLANRFVMVEKAETYIAAELAARGGEIGDELPVEFVIPTCADPSSAPPGQHILSALVRPLPRHPSGGWTALRPILGAKVVAALDKFIPNFSRDISHIEILTPDDFAAGAGTSVSRLMLGAAARIRTPVSGLFLCGADAEPVAAVSGRAARIAAGLAVRS